MSSLTTSAAKTTPALTFLILPIGTGAISLLQSLLPPLLPTIQHELGTTQAAVTWIVIAWLLAAAVATPVLGKVGDIIGKGRTLVVCLGLVALGSLIAALAPNIEMMIAGRVVQGFGGAAFPLAFGIVRDEFPANRVPSAVGWLSSVVAVGGGLGTILAGPVTDTLGWRWLYWLPMIVMVISAALAARFIPQAERKSGGRINIDAALLLAGWLLAMLLPLTQGSRWGWSSAPVLGRFAAAVILAGMWMLVELRSSTPLIDKRVMRLPAVWRANLAAFLFGAAMFAVWAYLPQLVQVPASSGYGFGATVSQAGGVMLPMLVTMTLAGMASGPLLRWVSSKGQAVIGAGLIALGSLALALSHQSLFTISVWSGVYGVGLGLAYAALVSIIVQASPASQTGSTVGMNSNIRTIGGAVGTAVMTAIVTARHSPDGLPLEQGFTTGFVLFAGVAAMAMLVAVMLPGSRQVQVAPARP